jgi:hypothetical protein
MYQNAALALWHGRAPPITAAPPAIARTSPHSLKRMLPKQEAAKENKRPCNCPAMNVLPVSYRRGRGASKTRPPS